MMIYGGPGEALQRCGILSSAPRRVSDAVMCPIHTARTDAMKLSRQRRAGGVNWIIEESRP